MKCPCCHNELVGIDLYDEDVNLDEDNAQLYTAFTLATVLSVRKHLSGKECLICSLSNKQNPNQTNFKENYYVII